MAAITATAQAENNGEHYTTQMASNSHRLIADEPIGIGGKDLGPSPGDYLCMALASCKAITLRMYAERKQWTVGKINVNVSLAKSETSTGDNTFLAEISFEVPLTEEQEQRLLQIAKACPVSRLLSRASEVVTTIV